MRTRSVALGLIVFILLTAATLRLPALVQTPPGLHYDEAANAILAAEIGLQGERPLFIASYTGKEVLFFYAAGGLMRLVGDSVFSLRLTAAFVGLLTIAATYWLGREITRDRRLALLAAALLAVSFWHLLFSRLGFRAIIQPLLQALTAAALLRGVRLSDRRWLAAAGVFLGLTAYTYLAARLFPVVVLLAALPLLFNRACWRQRWRQLSIVALVGLVVALPLLLYFFNNPDTFWVRIAQVSPSSQAPGLSESVLRALGMFFLVGDPYIRFNLPGQPLFDWFWGALLLVGWLVCWPRLLRVREDWQRSSLLLLLLGPLVMLLPTALATGEIVPSNLRAIGMLPFVVYLPVIGLLFVATDLERRFGEPQTTAVARLVLVLLVVAGGLSVDRDYFRVWAEMPDLFYETDGDLAAVAEFLDRLPAENTTIFVGAQHYQHPTLAFLSERYQQVKWLPQSEAFVLPAEGRALYVYPQNSPAPAWAQPFLNGANQYESDVGPGSQPTFTAYELVRPDTLTVPNPVNVNFGYAVTLLGYDVSPAPPGESLPVTLYWVVQASPPADFMPFVHLEDAWGYRWSQREVAAYPAAQWQAGEIFVQRVDLPVPQGAPPGNYQLRVGMFAPETGTRLSRLDGNGRFAGDAFVIDAAAVTVGEPPSALPFGPQVIDELVRPGLVLLGTSQLPPVVSTGERLPLALWWHAIAPQPDLTLRLELVPPEQPGRILGNTRPVHGTYPFTAWSPPQFVIDRQGLVIDDDVPPGEYRLRLRVLDETQGSIYTAVLGAITVEQTERLFIPPPVTWPLDATLGSEIKLLGYDLSPEVAGTYRLTLVWQALGEAAADYTVFVHMLNADGTCCLWQADVMPRQNQYPTTRWAPGEVVVDDYEIVLPAGTAPDDYALEVGMYIAASGQRLQVVMPGLPDSDVVWLRPLTVPDQ